MNKKRVFNFLVIVLLVIVLIIVLGVMCLVINKNEKICRLIGGQYIACTSNCHPGEICAQVCGPSRCEIFMKSKIITDTCQSDSDCVIIPSNCISAYKYGFDLKNIPTPPLGKEHICDNVQPICSQGKCGTRYR